MTREQAIKILAAHGFTPNQNTAINSKTGLWVSGTSFNNAFPNTIDRVKFMQWLGY